jgi:hypothetical protein
MLVAVRAMAPVAGRPPNSAEPHVGHALRDQFGVRAMAAAGHAVGHHCRQQRFDAGQEGDGERAPATARGALERNVRHRERPAAELGSSPKRCRWSPPAALQRGQRAGDHRDQESGPPGASLRSATISPRQASARPSARKVGVGAGFATGPPFRGRTRPAPLHRQPEQVLHLAGEDVTAMPAVNPVITGCGM